MPTTPMYRVQTTFTGVAGSPYYMVGYFEALEGAENAIISAWHTFCVPAPVAIPAGCLVTTSGEIDVVDPTTGKTVGTEIANTVNTAGSFPGQILPPANQVLIRWRTGVYIGGREVRGRTNIPLPLEESSSNNGTLSLQYKELYEDRAQAVVDGVAFDHVVWSKKYGRWERTTSATVWDSYAMLTSRRD